MDKRNIIPLKGGSNDEMEASQWVMVTMDVNAFATDDLFFFLVESY
jgi:hypothetical protein